MLNIAGGIVLGFLGIVGIIVLIILFGASIMGIKNLIEDLNLNGWKNSSFISKSNVISFFNNNSINLHYLVFYCLQTTQDRSCRY